jgi:hypothetical protein
LGGCCVWLKEQQVARSSAVRCSKASAADCCHSWLAMTPRGRGVALIAVELIETTVEL